MSWTLYATRGFYDRKGNFDSTQIEDGLEVGLYPAVVTLSKVSNKKAINGLCKYLKKKEIFGVPLKITSHGRGEFIDSRIPDVKDSIDLLIKLNERYGKKIIGDVDFHAGAVHTFKEEYTIRESALDKGMTYDDLDATYTAEEYYLVRESAKRKFKKIYNHAQKHGIDVSIENVAQDNFATRGYLPVIKKMGRELDYTIEELNNDKRFGRTEWIPEELHMGDFGCPTDLKTFTPGGFCIDVDHLGITVNHSKKHNFEKIGRPKMDRWQEKVFNECGIFVKKGRPVLFENEINPTELIGDLGERIKMCHIIGYQGQGMFYWDEVNGRKLKKIATHMPVTFENDPNEFIENDVIRRNIGLKTRETLAKYLSAFDKAGCRSAVTEVHLGSIYSGPKWRKYHEISRTNIKSLLKI
ncbi:MAG: hypothetical protein KAT37_02425 [Candidatus Aenigmarchaeota archaeon]|nr:hypothetical protein [Candidatus Aenigmarchaeota archaeon]